MQGWGIPGGAGHELRSPAVACRPAGIETIIVDGITMAGTASGGTALSLALGAGRAITFHQDHEIFQRWRSRSRKGHRGSSTDGRTSGRPPPATCHVQLCRNETEPGSDPGRPPSGDMEDMEEAPTQFRSASMGGACAPGHSFLTHLRDTRRSGPGPTAVASATRFVARAFPARLQRASGV